MLFTQIDAVPLRAEKLSKTGAVYYLRWLGFDNDIYVQIIDNFGGRGDGIGTFSRLLYRLSDVGQGKIYTGYDLSDGSQIETSDNNMSGFLRAIQNDIIRRADKQAKADIS